MPGWAVAAPEPEEEAGPEEDFQFDLGMMDAEPAAAGKEDEKKVDKDLPREEPPGPRVTGSADDEGYELPPLELLEDRLVASAR